MQVYNWPMGPKGLLYDRCWMVVNRNGVCLSQKREPSLCVIQPQVHLSSNKLLLQASGQIMFQQLIEKHTVLALFKNGFFCFVSPFCPAGMGTISVPLENTSDTHSSYKGCQNKVCGDRCADLYRKVLSVKLTRVICTTSPHSLPLSLKHPPTHAASLQQCEIASC